MSFIKEDNMSELVLNLEKQELEDSSEESEQESEQEKEDDSSEEYTTDSSSSIESTMYARDTLFGNIVYKNILFENKFSKILNFLEFSEENRGITQSHVNAIYDHYIKNPDQFIKPLDILCYFEEGMKTDHFYIADGQHRFMALKKLLENDNIDKDILYFIHDVKSQDDIKNKIKNLNSSNPVNSIYSFEKTPDLIKKIESKYTNIFSDNKNHNNDKMNKIKLRDHIEEIKLFSNEKHTVDFMFNKLLDFNKNTKDEFLKRENKISSDKKLFDRIAETHQFYALIFRDYTWINEFYNYINS